MKMFAKVSTQASQVFYPLPMWNSIAETLQMSSWLHLTLFPPGRLVDHTSFKALVMFTTSTKGLPTWFLATEHSTKVSAKISLHTWSKSSHPLGAEALAKVTVNLPKDFNSTLGLWVLISLLVHKTPIFIFRDFEVLSHQNVVQHSCKTPISGKGFFTLL